MTDAPDLDTHRAPAGESRLSHGARIEVRKLGKAYIHNGQALQVLRDVDLVLEPGDMVAVVGASGVGKSTLLQILGTYLVHHYVRSASAYGVFGTVLGLVAWIYLAVEATVYAAEVNVVLARHLWPRSMVQPPLTEADRASMALQALQNQRREEQHIEVSFHDRPPGDPVPDSTPQTPEEVTPPAS